MDMTTRQANYCGGKFLPQTESGTPSTIYDGAVGIRYVNVIVRRAGLPWSQQDLGWLWSVPLSSAPLY